MPKERLHLKPDSPEYWSCNNTHLDADKIILFLKSECDIKLFEFEEKLLRDVISAKNAGKEIIWIPARQSGITRMRECISIINALFEVK